MLFFKKIGIKKHGFNQKNYKKYKLRKGFKFDSSVNQIKLEKISLKFGVNPPPINRAVLRALVSDPQGCELIWTQTKLRVMDFLSNAVILGGAGFRTGVSDPGGSRIFGSVRSSDPCVNIRGVLLHGLLRRWVWDFQIELTKYPDFLSFKTVRLNVSFISWVFGFSTSQSVLFLIQYRRSPENEIPAKKIEVFNPVTQVDASKNTYYINPGLIQARLVKTCVSLGYLYQNFRRGKLST